MVIIKEEIVLFKIMKKLSLVLATIMLLVMVPVYADEPVEDPIENVEEKPGEPEVPVEEEDPNGGDELPPEGENPEEPNIGEDDPKPVGDTIEVNSELELNAAITEHNDITIKVNAPIVLNENLTIPVDKVFTLTGEQISKAADVSIVVEAGASLTLEHIVIDGGAVWADGENLLTSENTGVQSTVPMVQVKDDGTLTMNEGAIIQNSHSTVKGGAICLFGGMLNGNGGELLHNKALQGGAIYTLGGTVDMTDVKIHNNAGEVGGAIALENANVNIVKGNIYGNKASKNGGALYLSGAVGPTRNFGAININDTVFKDNTATENGGAIDMVENHNAMVNVVGGEFTGNIAENGNGGAINLLPYDAVATTDDDKVFYEKLNVNGTNFTDNSAGKGIGKLDKEKLPELFALYGEKIKDVKAISKPADETYIAYNNFDISFLTDDRYVRYDGNENTGGTAPVDENNPYVKGGEVTVLDKGDLIRTGYTFNGWNTLADGKGTAYAVGAKFNIEEDTVLYAQWKLNDTELEEEEEDDDNPPDYSAIIWNWDDDEEEEYGETYTHRAYISGYPDGTIKPAGKITRGEVAAIISRIMAGVEEIEYTNETSYGDVNASDWYAKHIAYISDKKVMEGYEDGNFNPEAEITRAEYATVIARLRSLKEVETTFEDAKGHWASGYIGAVAKEKWIEGYPDGTFKPEETISREEVATMTNKMLDRKVDEKGIGDLTIEKFTDLEHGSWSYYDMVEASNSHEYVRREKDSIVENWKKILD